MKHEAAPLSEEAFGPFKRLLENEAGFAVNAAFFSNTLRARMREHGFEKAQAYYAFLTTGSSGKEELKALIEQLTVGETSFFRYQAQWDVLRDVLLPELIRERRLGERSLRCWSAGCCSGEEAYSIAMTVLETLPQVEKWDVRILGTDINNDYLRKAEAGLYSERSVRSVPPDWRQKYFNQVEGRYAVCDAVKRFVRFEQYNLAQDSPADSRVSDVDVLFCRNVTIYFTLESTKRLMEQFAGRLHPGGYLFLGHAETLWQISDRFEPVEFPQTVIYRRMHDGTSPMPEPLLSPRPFLELPQAPLPAKAPDQHVLLFQAWELANQGAYTQAIPLLLKVLEEDNLSDEAYHLLGTLYCRIDQSEKALEAFKRALYVDPINPLAYMNMGSIYRYQRRLKEAERAFKNVLKILDKRAPESRVPFAEDMSCASLRAACVQQLQVLQAGVER